MSNAVPIRETDMSQANQAEKDLMQELEFFGGEFARRHIGPRMSDVQAMLKVVGYSSLEALTDATVPAAIRVKESLALDAPQTEQDALTALKELAEKNQPFRSFIGHGFYNTITPTVILRNIMENPGWYTQYTPYQAEISQGRLEALVNFQQMICDLTGMEIANASMLDEGSAAAEAMTLCYRQVGSETRNKIFVAANCHQHVIDVVNTRAEPLGLQLVLGDLKTFKPGPEFFAVMIQYPATDGAIENHKALAERAHQSGALVIASADILALTMIQSPGEWGADVVVGNSQRFGVPLGFGGPHAGFMATKEAYKRDLPGRLVGVSKDADGKPAYRLALQTREQHIRREKATSNICTAQVLLAIMAGMYAAYHGPAGLKRIARRVHGLTQALARAVKESGCEVRHNAYFDTLRVDGVEPLQVKKRARDLQINLREFEDGSFGVSLDETTSPADLNDIVFALSGKNTGVKVSDAGTKTPAFAASTRTSEFLTHPVFNQYHSETELLRYINRLQAKDLSLTTSMIPLGSCTMKLNATSEMIPVTWREFGGIHPLAPREQAMGYLELFSGLKRDLATITGLPGVSLQPNAGSQGEYAGLLVIRAYHTANKQPSRNICLIPASAHGTNPATASMAGMEVVVVACDEQGNVDVADLKKKATEHADKLAALMVTYPSTHGVFEESIREICEVVHKHGGQVYMDGANLNAQVGLCRPGDFGVDVCHLNLHKTFCIPHGGGGPGVGPICTGKHLMPYLPGHFVGEVGGEKAAGPVCSAPWGSAGILVIPYLYIKMMGEKGLRRATQVAILNANYVAKRLADYFPTLYRGKSGTVAHECILDLRSYKRKIGVEVADVAKRLMDYGFHAPTVSFPVVETLMVEPTESESKEELDRFCDAMIGIHGEMAAIESGKIKVEDSPLKHSPHTAEMATATEWKQQYSREEAVFPAQWLYQHKYWPSVRRIDGAYGDRNLFCACVPVTAAD